MKLYAAVVTQSIYAPTNNQRIADYLHKTALQGNYTRSPCPYPSRSLSDASPLSGIGQAALNDDYRPEMADCRGW